MVYVENRQLYAYAPIAYDVKIFCSLVASQSPMQTSMQNAKSWNENLLGRLLSA